MKTNIYINRRLSAHGDYSSIANCRTKKFSRYFPPFKNSYVFIPLFLSEPEKIFCRNLRFRGTLFEKHCCRRSGTLMGAGQRVLNTLRTAQCRVRFPAEATNLSLLQNIYTVLRPTRPPMILCTGDYLPGVNRSERGTDHLPPSSAEIRNE